MTPVAAPTLRIDEETKNRASLTGAQLAEQNKAAAAAEAKAKKEAAAVQVSSFHALSAFLISSPPPIPRFEPSSHHIISSPLIAGETGQRGGGGRQGGGARREGARQGREAGAFLSHRTPAGGS